MRGTVIIILPISPILPKEWAGKFFEMKLSILLIGFFILSSAASHAQLYEMESSRNMDMSSKRIKPEKVSFTLDSTRMSLHSGDHTYYYDATKPFTVDDNGVINMTALDLNDAEVLIKFSPGAKVLDYYLGEYGIRYFLDKVEQPKPEEDSATAKKDTASDEEKAAKLDTMIYDNADVMPEFTGGKQAMLNFLAKNVKYPSAAKKSGVKGFEQASIIVEKDGSIKYIKITSDIGGGCSEEAIRVIKLMPKWTPGENKDEAVRVRVPIDISFMPK
jgi:hypothetical protein